MITTGNKKGFALVFSLLIMLLIILICTAYFSILTNELTMANRITDSIRAYYIADAGLADAFMQLRAAANPTPVFSTSNNNYPAGPGNRIGSYTVGWKSDGASWPTYTITSVSTYPNSSLHPIHKTLVLQVHMISFSRWDYVSNSEVDPYWGPLWWITGMITIGPCFTDSQFNMFGTPTFDGPVGQASSAIDYFHPNSNPQYNPSGGPLQDNPNFQNGLTLNAPSLSIFTSPNDVLNNISTAAAQPSQGLLLTGITTITLSNGIMYITNQNNSWNNQSVSIPNNGALFVKSGDVMVGGALVHQNGDVTVQGQLSGQLTIGSDSNIFIGGNILYHDKTNPDKTAYTGNDLLGLVAQNNVIVNDLPPGNIEIDGYIVALLGSFQVQNFWEANKGNMIQFGGLSNQICGPTGMMDWNGNIIAGYNQLQYYDTRLQSIAPLWFPSVKDAAGRTTYVKVKLNEL